jgi:hypothetical protein
MDRWERLAALSGFGFVALVVASNALFSPPGYGASNARMVAYMVDHHRRGLVAGILAGLALIALLWLLGSLASALYAGGERRLAAIAFGGGLLALAVGALQTILLTGLAFRVAYDDPGAVKGLYDLRAAIGTLLAFPLAALGAATAIAVLRAGLLPRWYGWASAVTAVVTIVRGGALAHSGFYSPGGGYGVLAYVVVLLWVLATSVVLMMRPPLAGAPV